MPLRVDVAPAMLAWARDRSGHDRDALHRRFPRLREWEEGTASPTIKQLEDFAKATQTPVGYFFLSEVPAARLPIPDFRTFGDDPVPEPSPNLLDTVAICEERQDWYRDFVRQNGSTPLDFIGSLERAMSPQQAAASMQSILHFDVETRRALPNWSAALRALSDAAERSGVLVMISGIVGSNTHRKLDPQEFRGFALVDRFAPLVFINGADTKAAQIFTLAHELVHLWLGESAVSNAELNRVSQNDTERWCNRVAAELLVPMAALDREYRPQENLLDQSSRLARTFKVSTLVILRRIHDAGHVSWDTFRAVYGEEIDRLTTVLASNGGNYYNTQPVRVSKRFTRAIIGSTLEGQTLHRDAFRLLGFNKQSTFDELARRYGMA